MRIELTLSDSCPYPAALPPLKLPLVTTHPHPCPYLPDRIGLTRAFYADTMPPAIYEALMLASFRRSGRIFYQPICRGCRQCLPIRVPVCEFVRSKSQRRCWNRNQDLAVEVGSQVATDEKFELYKKYVQIRHGRENEDRSDFEDFLFDSPIDTIEFDYRLDGRLAAVGICDVCPRSLSSVYFYFDPDESRRGLGVFSSMVEIQYAVKKRIEYYYLGYWVEKSASMNYKSRFRPCQVLYPDGQWRTPNEDSQSEELNAD